MMKYLGSFLVLIFGVTACENVNDTNVDIIDYAVRAKVGLICRTNEPFLSIEFNSARDETGRVLFTNPNELVNGEIQSVEVERTAGDTPNPSDTFFRLSNNVEGTISRTPNGACMDDMAGTPHNYKITITRWNNDDPVSLPHSGCCDLVQ